MECQDVVDVYDLDLQKFRVFSVVNLIVYPSSAFGLGHEGWHTD